MGEAEGGDVVGEVVGGGAVGEVVGEDEGPNWQSYQGFKSAFE